MKHKLPRILIDIRGYSIPPPQKIFESVKRQLFNLEEDDNLNNFFKPLQNAEVEPPADTFLKIINKIKVQEDAEKKNGVLTYFYRLTTIAAVIIMIAGAWLGLRQISSGKQVLQPVAQQVLPASPSLHQTDSLLPELAIKPGTVNPNAANKTRRKITKQTILLQQDYFTVLHVGVNGYNFPVISNDLLFTFASYRNDKVPPFLISDEDDEFIIDLSPDEDIVVCSKMRKNIADIFKTNNKGKPMRKTKKAKAKLDKWRKMDIVQFDDYLIHNPLDPVDLGDFIFKN